MNSRHIFLLLMMVWMAAARGQKRAFQISDLYQIKNVHSPQISPDGKRIAFVVTAYFLEAGKSDADIYLMNLDGNQLKQMTRNPAADFHPFWSPDGQYLYFLSTRTNGVQLWRLPVDGGEAEQITNFPTGIQNPMMTPGGKAIVFFQHGFSGMRCRSRLQR